MVSDLSTRLENLSQPEPNSGCFIWLGTTRNKYGIINYDGKPRFAHRIYWEYYKGEIPDGMLVCHTCDNPMCVNPKHLEVVSQQENIRRGAGLKLSRLDLFKVRCFRARGYTQKRIGELLGVHQCHISRIISGLRIVN